MRKARNAQRERQLADIVWTGANTGIGFATAKIIVQASKDYHVIIAGRNLEKAKAAVSKIESMDIKGQLSALQLDVTDEKSVEQAAASVDGQFGRLDVLINNAGTASGTTGEDVLQNPPPLKNRFQACLDTNVIGPAVVSAIFRPLLLKSSNPYSIYVSSVVGSLGLAVDPSSPYYNPIPGGDSYRASKAALNMVILQEYLSSQDTPLKIFAMCPGYVVSNLRGSSEQARSGYGKAGSPDESGRTILSMIRGERDSDVGKFVHKDGLYPW